jgi:large subunit ribosomal protein L4
MPTVDVVDLKNQVVGTLELNDSVFAAPVNEALIWEAVRHYLACQRRGTAKTKTRHEVSGSGKKLWRQKGTGRARMGSIRSPLWRHGGTVHGPVPRDYSYRLPRKMLLGALRAALSAKLRDGELKVVRAFDLPDHKTKTLAAALKTLDVSRKALLVDVLPAAARPAELEAPVRNLLLGARNLPGIDVKPSFQVTVYDLLAHEMVLLSEAAARKMSEGLAQ